MGFCVNLSSRCVGWLAVVCAAPSEVEAECGNRLSRESKRTNFFFRVEVSRREGLATLPGVWVKTIHG